MPKYGKRPVIIEATQWFKNGDHPEDYSQEYYGIDSSLPPTDNLRQFSAAERKEKDFEGDIVRRYNNPADSGTRNCEHCGRKMKDHGWIETLEGGHIVCPGDFVITGVKGERYPCKPDIFEASYEPVEEAT